MKGKFLQSGPRPKPCTKLLWHIMLTRDLFAVVNLLVSFSLRWDRFVEVERVKKWRNNGRWWVYWWYWRSVMWIKSVRWSDGSMSYPKEWIAWCSSSSDCWVVEINPGIPSRLWSGVALDMHAVVLLTLRAYSIWGGRNKTVKRRFEKYTCQRKVLYR